MRIWYKKMEKFNCFSIFFLFLFGLLTKKCKFATHYCMSEYKMPSIVEMVDSLSF